MAQKTLEKVKIRHSESTKDGIVLNRDKKKRKQICKCITEIKRRKISQ